MFLTSRLKHFIMPEVIYQDKNDGGCLEGGRDRSLHQAEDFGEHLAMCTGWCRL